MSRLTVIVVNYRQRDLLRECLGSIETALGRVEGGGDMLVVDNASDDGSSEMVRREFPGVTLVELGENRGFGGGVNEGLRRSSGDWIALFNNDATVAPDALMELLGAADLHPDVGSVAAQMRFADRPDIINSAGIEVDRLGVAWDRLLGEPGSARETAPVEVFGTSGGAGLYRRALLDALGGFDASFFAYLEDVDVAWRARMRGWRCLYVPAAVVHHHHSATARHASGFKHYWSGRNRVRLVAKNATAGQLRRHGAAMVAWDIAYVAWAGLGDRTLAPLRGRLAGLRDWRRYRSAGAEGRRPVELSPVRGLGWALRRRRTGPRAQGDAALRARRAAPQRGETRAR